MPIWKVTDSGLAKVPETKPKTESMLEAQLEEWIASNPNVLGESLLVIGQQVRIPEINDRLDILALDTQGNAVIIELKRGKLQDPVDMQALRYCSYITNWKFEDFENQARTYLRRVGDPEFNFNEIYEEFCSEAGAEDLPVINTDQRIVIVGAEVKDKLGSVALWLLEHNIDIKVVQVEMYRDGKDVLIQPQVIVPQPVQRFSGENKRVTGDSAPPWVVDGKKWHLDKRCSPLTRSIFLKLDGIISEIFEVDGPVWNQKAYVAYRIGSNNWITIETKAKVIRLCIRVRAGSFSQPELAQKLMVEEFNTDDPLSDKLNLPSSVRIQTQNDNSDRVLLRVKEDFDLDNSAFISFLQNAWEKFPKQ